MRSVVDPSWLSMLFITLQPNFGCFSAISVFASECGLKLILS